MDAGPDTDGGDSELADKRRKRNEIIAAARGEFARIGYRAATIRGIAMKAQVSTRTIYDYFNDKLALFNDCIAFDAAVFFQPGLSWGGAPDAALEGYVVAILRHLTSGDSFKLSLMIFRDVETNPELKEVAKRTHETYFLQPLEAFLRQMDIEPQAATALARLFNNMATSEWQRRILYGEPAQDDLEIVSHAERVTRVFLHGQPMRRDR